MKGLIYTAEFGGYDRKQPPRHRLDGVEYLRITDGEECPGWLHSPMRPVISPRWMNRFLKMNIEALLPDPVRYDWIMYIDASMSPTKVLSVPIIETWLSLGAEACFFKHPERTTAQEELAYCKEVGKIPEDAILPGSHFDFLMVSTPGLWAGGMFLRRPSSRLGAIWWKYYLESGVSRDQISLPAAIRHNAQEVHTIETSVWNNLHFKFTPHRSSP